jgi:lipopolysaccharide transport system permease protein
MPLGFGQRVVALLAPGWLLLGRDLAKSRRASLLGLGELFLPPLVVTAGCVMGLRAGLLNFTDVRIPYAVYVLVSMVLWSTFVDSVFRPIEIFAADLSILNERMGDSASLVVMTSLLRLGVDLIARLAVAAVVGAALGGRLSPFVLLAPLPIVLLMLFGMSIGLVLAPVVALYRDVGTALRGIMLVWLFLTPVLFAAPSIGALAAIVRYNPVTPLLGAARALALTGSIPDPTGLAVTTAAIPFLLVLGCRTIRAAVPRVAEAANV